MPVTARKLKATERLAEASARASLSETVDARDAEGAGQLMVTSVLNDSAASLVCSIRPWLVAYLLHMRSRSSLRGQMPQADRRQFPGGADKLPLLSHHPRRLLEAGPSCFNDAP